jgi:hypothetical protein
MLWLHAFPAAGQRMVTANIRVSKRVPNAHVSMHVHFPSECNYLTCSAGVETPVPSSHYRSRTSCPLSSLALSRSRPSLPVLPAHCWPFQTAHRQQKLLHLGQSPRPPVPNYNGTCPRCGRSGRTRPTQLDKLAYRLKGGCKTFPY